MSATGVSTGILGCVWGLGNVTTTKEPTFLKFEVTAESFKRFKGGGAPRGSHFVCGEILDRASLTSAGSGGDYMYRKHPLGRYGRALGGPCPQTPTFFYRPTFPPRLLETVTGSYTFYLSKSRGVEMTVAKKSGCFGVLPPQGPFHTPQEDVFCT